MKRFIKSLAALVIVVLVALIIAEVVARVIFSGYMPILKLSKYMESERGKFTRYDPLIGWVGKERADDSFEWLDTLSHVRQNRYGYRDAGYDFVKGAKRRLLILGDSFVWGFGVENEDIFTSRIDSMNGDMEVINLGVSGYTTDQEYLIWYKLGRKWSPEDVLLLILPSNDLDELVDNMPHGYMKPTYVLDSAGTLKLKHVPVPRRRVWEDRILEDEKNKTGKLQSILSYSTLANLTVGVAIRNNNIREFLTNKGVIPNRRSGGGSHMIYMNEPPDEVKKGWELLLKLVALLNQSVSENGGRLKVAVIPSNIQVYPELWKNYLKTPSIPGGVVLDQDATFNIIRRGCEKMDIEVIDIVSDLREAGKSNPYLYFPLNSHWTSDGHQVVADTLSRAFSH